MDELVRWLGKQLDEDERIARAAAHLSGALSAGALAAGERWRVSGNHSDEGGAYWSVATASPDLDRIPTVEMVGSGMSGGGAHTEAVAWHIAEHDPARVLREIDAKRQILSDELDRVLDAGKPARYLERSRLVRLLALPYADRPGYREEWRP